MRKKAVSLTAFLILFGCASSRADFKYSETSKITGGAMAGAMKVAGVFSKKAREPVVTTHYFKGHRMRTESSDGHATIIDVDARQIIEIDNNQRTYSVMTFDQMRQALEQARAKAEEEMKKQNQAQDQKNPNVTIVPKFEVTNGTGSATLLGLPTQEVKMHLEMLMQSTDPSQPGQAQMWIDSDSYRAASVPGAEEMREFGVAMAKELNWMPGAMFGGSNIQMSNGMTEFRKAAEQLQGFPLLQYMSMGMNAPGQPGAASPGSAPAQSSPPPSAPPSAADMIIPGHAAAKALGGMLGGFHHKKKQQEQAASAPAAPPPPANGGSLMDITEQVTSYSNDSLDSSLFAPPAGYQQVQVDAQKVLGQAH
jgi:hypothetical protein